MTELEIERENDELEINPAKQIIPRNFREPELFSESNFVVVNVFVRYCWLLWFPDFHNT